MCVEPPCHFPRFHGFSVRRFRRTARENARDPNTHGSNTCVYFAKKRKKKNKKSIIQAAGRGTRRVESFVRKSLARDLGCCDPRISIGASVLITIALGSIDEAARGAEREGARRKAGRNASREIDDPRRSEVAWAGGRAVGGGARLRRRGRRGGRTSTIRFDCVDNVGALISVHNCLPALNGAGSIFN